MSGEHSYPSRHRDDFLVRSFKDGSAPPKATIVSSSTIQQGGSMMPQPPNTFPPPPIESQPRHVPKLANLLISLVFCLRQLSDTHLSFTRMEASSNREDEHVPPVSASATSEPSTLRVEGDETETRDTLGARSSRTSISNLAPPGMRDDVWSCLIVLVTFWSFGQNHLLPQ